MTSIKIIREVFTILFGVGAIVAGIVFEADDPWLFILGIGFILWGVWDIYKEVRDSSDKGDVSELSKQREDISNKLGEK